MDLSNKHVDDCKSGWLMVEKDFTSRLFKQEQLKYALQCMGRNPSDKVVSRYWTQCGGSMSYEQFCLVMKRERKTTMGDLMNSFRKIDINGDGYIDTQELHKVLTKRGEKMSRDEVQAIIDEADENGDGKLDYAEFCHMLLNTSEETIQAAKQKAIGQTRQTGLTGSGRQKGSTNKHRSSRSLRDHTRKGSFDRQKQREDIHSKLFPQDSQQRIGHGYLTKRQSFTVESDKEEQSGTENGHGPLQFSRQSSSSRATRAKLSDRTQQGLARMSPLHVESVPANDLSTVCDSPHGGDELLNPQTESTVLGQSEHSHNPTLDNKAPVNSSDQREPSASNSQDGDKPDVGSTSIATIDPLELASNSATKLPPLKKTMLPPLLPPIAGGTSKDKEVSTAKVSATPSPNHQPEVTTKDPESSSPVSTLDVKNETERTRNGEVGDGKGENTETSQSVQSEQNISKEEMASVDKDHSQLQLDPTSGNEEKQSNPSTAGDTPSHKNDPKPSSEPDKLQSHESVDSSTRKGSGREGAVGSSQPTEDDSDRQTDHLNRESASENREEEGGRRKKVETSTPTSVVASPPKKPKNIQSWNSITGKGCFYLDLDEATPSSQEEDGVIRCHHYRLKLPSPTNVWIEVGVVKPGISATDVLLFVFHTDENEDPTDLITYTQHKVGEHWISKLDLDAGTYALIPSTSRCYLKPREDHMEEDVPLVSEEGGHVSLSDQCRGALEEVFHRMDLDSNGYVSRTEFDFFQERTSGEICDDEAWKVIQDNFELTADDELTLKGFLDLHVMTAEDEEGGEGEVRDILDSLGYNNQLQLDQACPFVFDLYTEDNEGEIEIVDLLPFAPLVDPALSQLVRERGVCEAVKEGKGELDLFTFTTPHMTTIVVENKSVRNASVQLDCSASTNCVFSRDSPLYVLTIPAQSSLIGFQVQPLNPLEPHKVDCIASKILC